MSLHIARDPVWLYWKLSSELVLIALAVPKLLEQMAKGEVAESV